MKKILTLDLGSTMGWCSGEQCGSHEFNGDRQQRAASTLVWLDRWLLAAQPDLIVYERPFARGRAATRALWGLAGVVEAVGTARDILVLDAENKTWKKFIHGSGNATKEDTIAWARAMGYSAADEHAADAVAIWHWAQANLETS